MRRSSDIACVRNSSSDVARKSATPGRGRLIGYWFSRHLPCAAKKALPSLYVCGPTDDVVRPQSTVLS